MSRSRGQSADRLYDLFPADGLSRNERFALRHLRHERCACHCRNAPLGFETNLSEAVVLHSRKQFQNVSASRILQSYVCIRIGKFTGIARMLEVIEHLR